LNTTIKTMENKFNISTDNLSNNNKKLKVSDEILKTLKDSDFTKIP